jgi:hypothetical protein
MTQTGCSLSVWRRLLLPRLILGPEFLESMRKMSDDRQYARAARHNRDFILDVLRDVLPRTGVILEIASGSGEHVVHFARNLPALPSDLEPDARLSVAAWVKATAVTNMRAPCSGRLTINLANRFGRRDHLHQHGPHFTLGRDARIDQGGGRGTFTVVAVLSLWPVQTRRVRNGSEQPGVRPGPSRSQPDLGLRDLEAVAAIAQTVGFSAPAVTEMPANNLSVVFRRI